MSGAKPQILKVSMDTPPDGGAKDPRGVDGGKIAQPCPDLALLARATASIRGGKMVSPADAPKTPPTKRELNTVNTALPGRLGQGKKWGGLGAFL